MKILKRFLSMIVVMGLVCSFLSREVMAQVGVSDHGALKETQDFLKDKSQREVLFKKDPKAREADSKLNSVTGGDAANHQKIYEVTADIMPALMNAAGNDPTKAMELLQKAQTDPEGFYKSLPPEVRSKIRGIAADVEAKGSVKKSP